MKKQEKANTVLVRLEKNFGKQKTALRYKNVFELLVATILSAQCTDKQVNIVTKKLFKKYKKISDYSSANKKEFEKDIYSTGFYKNKSKNIVKCAKIIEEKFNEEVPRTMKELIQLPGVARKTANIVLSSGYGLIEGIAVDTHVKRLAFRIGLTKQKEPKKIEKDLLKIVPRKKWANFSLLLIEHGRKTCTARKPNCKECFLSDVCSSAFIFS